MGRNLPITYIWHDIFFRWDTGRASGYYRAFTNDIVLTISERYMSYRFKIPFVNLTADYSHFLTRMNAEIKQSNPFLLPSLLNKLFIVKWIAEI